MGLITVLKALSLTQPWATLIALGIKLAETRDRSAGRRMLPGEVIAIHATRNIAPNDDLVPDIVDEMAGRYGRDWRNKLPLGSVVALARFKMSAEVVERESGLAIVRVRASEQALDHYDSVPIDSFGDFSIGRHLWVFDAVQSIEPIPARGMPSVWPWHDCPPHILEAAQDLQKAP